MSTIAINGVDYHYIEQGRGAETIVFAHGVLMHSGSFAAQLAHFAPTYRCIAFDWRGHGRSAAPRFGYDVDGSLTRDAQVLIRQLGGGPVHFVGVALGGFVGLQLARSHPELLRSLTVVAGAADAEPPAQVRRLTLLAALARLIGVRPLAELILRAQFAPRFLADPAQATERLRWRTAFQRLNTPTAVEALMQEVRHGGLPWAAVAELSIPALIIHGAQDRAVAASRARRLATALPGAQFVLLPEVGHCPTIEDAPAVNRHLAAFLRQVTVPQEMAIVAS